MNRCKRKGCGVPVVLMEFPAGERLWMHAPVIGIHDEIGEIYDVAHAYFYCSSKKAS